jgi:catechol 2,3-dioxygenase-like lactoylglutathione lyase family enzyme
VRRFDSSRGHVVYPCETPPTIRDCGCCTWFSFLRLTPLNAARQWRSLARNWRTPKGTCEAVPRKSRSKIEGVSLPVTLPLIDHLALRVRDERRSRTFYEQALEPFGVKVVESSRGPGFAIEGGGDFWIEEGEPPAAPVHVAFAAADRATVDKFHRAAVEAGGRDNGAPGLRPHYHAGYYAAFVIDPDGNNVEAVFHGDRQLPAT